MSPEWRILFKSCISHHLLAASIIGAQQHLVFKQIPGKAVILFKCHLRFGHDLKNEECQVFSKTFQFPFALSFCSEANWKHSVVPSCLTSRRLCMIGGEVGAFLPPTFSLEKFPSNPKEIWSQNWWLCLEKVHWDVTAPPPRSRAAAQAPWEKCCWLQQTIHFIFLFLLGNSLFKAFCSQEPEKIV